MREEAARKLGEGVAGKEADAANADYAQLFMRFLYKAILLTERKVEKYQSPINIKDLPSENALFANISTLSISFAISGLADSLLN